MNAARVASLLLLFALVARGQGLAPTTTERALGTPPDTSQRIWSLQDGLPQASVTCVTQTRDGYLWCGTFGGLVRFDGARFVVHELATAPGLASNRILSLAEAVDGALWIGTEEGGLSRLSDGEFTTYGGDQGVGPGPVWSLHVDQRGALWAGTARGLRRLDGERFTRPELDDPAGLLDAGVLDIADAGAGGLWIAGNRGVLRVDPRAGRVELVHATPPGEAVLSVVERNDRSLWFGAEALMRRSPDGDVQVVAADTGDVWDLLQDRDGTLWVAARGGPLRVVGDALTPADPRDRQRSLRCLFEDRERNLWAGLSLEGLMRLRRGELVGYGVAQGVPRGVSVVTPAPGGGVWVGHEDGLLRVSDGRITSWALDTATSALLPEHDALLVGTGDEGLLRLEHGAYQRVDLGGPAPGALRALLRDRHGRLWVGGQEGLRVETADGWRAYTHDTGLVDDDVRCLLEDREGTVWIGTAHGVSRVRDGEWMPAFASGEQLPRGMVRAFHEDPGGAVWIGTYGGGLIRWQGGRLSVLTSEQGLTENIVSVILPDGPGHVVLNGNRGVSRYALADLHAVADGERARVGGTLYPAAPGMTTGEGNGGSQPAGCVAADGALWLPTIEGLVRLDTSVEAAAALPLGVLIEELVVDDVSLPVDGSARAEPGRRDVTIRYTALGLSQPERLQFRYRLANRGGDWVDAGARREAVYTGLPPGAHRFEVSVRNEDGVWSRAPTRLTIRLAPHLWETAGFAVALSLLALAVVGLDVWRRVRRTRRQTRRLEALVQERTRELEAEVDVRRRAEQRLREARDELELRVQQRTAELAEALQSLKDDVSRRKLLERQLLQSQKLEGVGRLAGGVAHDFNNLLTVIRGCAHGLGEKLSGPVDELTELNDATDRAARLTRQLLSFARQDVVRRRVLDLNALVGEASGLLRRLLGEEVELVGEPHPAPVPVHADPNQLEQVLVNLCVNARDAMPRGGRIAVDVAPVELDTAAAGELGLPAGPYASLSVRDQGEGMPADVRARAFDPFFTTKQAGQGSGLGLSTCYGIVRELGGHIAIDSEPGDGTTITVLLPRSDRAPAPHPAPESDDDLRGQGTVLLIEDQDAVRKALAAMLVSLGFVVREASGGEQALDLARREPGAVDVVLCDVVMPGMRGPELLAALRTSGLAAPAVLMTGHADEPLPADVAKAVIVKPPTRRDLVEALRAARA